jgi:uracil phosphoribosyltransferase
MTEHFPTLRLLDHPLIQHKLSKMRDKTCPTMQFRRLLKEIALRIETPLMPMDAPIVLGKKLAIVSILRAGLVMADGLHELVPSARTGHIGLYRDHDTHRPVEYLVKLPEPEGRLFILVDPMLATGNSACHALDVLNRHGVEDARIRFMALVIAPEGMTQLAEKHPGVAVYGAALDERLNENAYILPGLGDAGDRLFGTK